VKVVLVLRWFAGWSFVVTVFKTLLTAKFIESATKAGRYFDSEIVGFYLQVTSTGRKLYGCRAKNPETKQPMRTSIGDASRMSLQEARRLAEKYLEQIRSGFNPVASKKHPAGTDSRDMLLAYLSWTVNKLGGKAQISNEEIQRYKGKPLSITLVDSGVIIKVTPKPRS